MIRVRKGTGLIPVRAGRAALAAACALFCLLAVAALAQQAGGVRGSIWDKDFGVPLASVRVTVVELSRSVTTGDDGNFVIDAIPPGSYTMTFSKPGYQRTIATDVVINEGRLTDLRVDLGAEVVDLPALIVTGGDLLAESEIAVMQIRAESDVIQDTISAELIGQAGAGNVADALTKVTGVSVRDGKYATVRGLSDRYTGTTLNGVRIPSADPRRRSVQVDLFPTGTIENVTVTKSFTPDLQGDFTGGGVDIQTRSIPDGRTFSLSLSTEHDSIATGNDRFLTYVGGGLDADGTATDVRKLPAIAAGSFPAVSPAAINPSAVALENAQLTDEITRAFDPVMGTTRGSAKSNRGFSFVGGNRFSFGKNFVLGTLGALSYSHKYEYFEGGVNNTTVVSGADATLVTLRERSDSRGVEELLIGGLASVVFRMFDTQEIGLIAVVNQAAEDSARLQVRDISAGERLEQNQALAYTERTVSSIQLQGQHDLPRATAAAGPIEIDWIVSQNKTDQDEPDVRFFRNVFDTTTLGAEMPANSTDAQNTRRIFRDIFEDNAQVKLDVSLPFLVAKERRARVKLGLLTDSTDRVYEQRSFNYTFQTQFGSFLNPIFIENLQKSRYTVESVDELWTDVFTAPDRIGLAPVRCDPGQSPFLPANQCAAANQLLWYLRPTGDDVDYDAVQEIDAYYAMVELPLGPFLKFVGGARRETTLLEIAPVNELFGVVETILADDSGNRSLIEVPDEEGRAEVRRSDTLPAAALTWDILQHRKPNAMQLRASWSRTIARPTFRELAPVATEEFILGDEFLGNPDVVLSEIENWDLRWEWFRRPGEVLAASLFYKDLTNPIEYISFGASNRSFIQPINFPHGELRGFEVEARTAFDVVWEKLADLSIGVNYAQLETEVELPEIERLSLASFALDEPTRRLQGQPEYIVNANLTYENEESGTTASLFYNTTGDTLVTGSARGFDDGTPSVFEEGRADLDFSFKQEIPWLGRRAGGDFAVTLRAKNLLTSDRRDVYRTPNGDEAVKAERETPLRISVGVSMKW